MTSTAADGCGYDVAPPSQSMRILSRVRPGVFVAMLAFASIIYTVFIEHATFNQKLFWLSLFGILAALEIAVIYSVGQRVDREAASSRNDALTQFRITLAHFRNLNQLIQLGPKKDLKRRALELSEELLTLVYDHMFRPSDPPRNEMVQLAALFNPLFADNGAEAAHG